jgi:DNA-binding transcriptional MerR regulator
MYRKRDVEMVATIKDLLYERGFTIAGARKVLSSRKDAAAALSPVVSSPKTQPQPARPAPEKLDQVKVELRNILTILNRRC